MEHTRDRAEEKASRAEDKVCLFVVLSNSKNTCVGKGTHRGAWHGQQDNQVNEHHGREIS